MIELSIIIVNFNIKDLTLQCIESIVKSKPKTEYEIIVVDNNSTDGSVTALRRLRSVDGRLQLIDNKENLGFPKANNQGIKKAKGKYILLLGSDTRVQKRTIDRLYEFAKKTPDAGVVAARLLNLDGSIQGSAFRLPTIGRAIKQYWLGQGKILDKYAPEESTAVAVEVAVMTAFLITPKALKKIGFLDERYFVFFEDLDYCRRAHKVGLKVYYLPTAEVVHHHGASGRKLAKKPDQWRRLIPSSKIYHGRLKHYLLTAIMWSGQKWQKFLKNIG